MIFNVTYPQAGGPSYDDGDNILYPQSNIPTGTKKLYTEQSVSNIAKSLRKMLNDNTLTYNVGDMADAGHNRNWQHICPTD